MGATQYDPEKAERGGGAQKRRGVMTRVIEIERSRRKGVTETRGLMGSHSQFALVGRGQAGLLPGSQELDLTFLIAL